MNINQALERGRNSLAACKKYQCSWVAGGSETSQAFIAKGFKQLIDAIEARVGCLDNVTNLEIVEIEFE